ncbi:MAG: hypothetical protein GY795_20890 [Desulfobacterales bacterium]|nr:hypothetical protein [Desulfobacterales bacterium]
MKNPFSKKSIQIDDELYIKLGKTIVPRSDLSIILRLKEFDSIISWIREFRQLFGFYLNHNDELLRKICSDILDKIYQANTLIGAVDEDSIQKQKILTKEDHDRLTEASSMLIDFDISTFNLSPSHEIVERLINKFRNPVFTIEGYLIHRVAVHYGYSKDYRNVEYLNKALSFFGSSQNTHIEQWPDTDVNMLLSLFEEKYSQYQTLILSIDDEDDDDLIKLLDTSEFKMLTQAFDDLESAKIPEKFITDYSDQFEKIQQIKNYPFKSKLYLLSIEQNLTEKIENILITPLLNQNEFLSWKEFQEYHKAFQNQVRQKSASQLVDTLKYYLNFRKKFLYLHELLENINEDIKTLVSKYKSDKENLSRFEKQRHELESTLTTFLSSEQWLNFLTVNNCIKYFQRIEQLNKKIPEHFQIENIFQNEDLLETCIKICHFHLFKTRLSDIEDEIFFHMGELREELLAKYLNTKRVDLEDELKESLSNYLNDQKTQLKETFNKPDYIQVIKMFENRYNLIQSYKKLNESQHIENILQWLSPFADEHDEVERNVQLYLKEKEKLKTATFHPEQIESIQKPLKQDISSVYSTWLFRFFSFMDGLHNEIRQLPEIKFTPPTRQSDFKKAIQDLGRIMLTLDIDDQHLLMPYLEKCPNDIFQQESFPCNEQKKLAKIIHKFLTNS